MQNFPKYIEIETSRFCNRHCSWCPNGSFDFRSDQQLMPWFLFEKFLIELKSLEYSGWLAFHNYNEPLANKRIIEEVRFAKSLLPSVRPSVFTNGDYLNQSLLRYLLDAGVSYIRTTLYPSLKDSSKGYDKINEWIEKKKLKEITWEAKNVRQGLAMAAVLNKCEIEIINPNIEAYNWRGGTTHDFLEEKRIVKCLMTYHSASIDYLGNLKMCCNVFPEFKGHEEYIIGNISNNSFLDLWNSEIINQYREHHQKADWSFSPVCVKCKHYLPESQTTELNTV